MMSRSAVNECLDLFGGHLAAGDIATELTFECSALALCVAGPLSRGAGWAASPDLRGR